MSETIPFDPVIFFAELGQWEALCSGDHIGTLPGMYCDGRMIVPDGWTMRRKPQPAVKWMVISADGKHTGVWRTQPNNLMPDERQFRITIPPEGEPTIERVDK